MLEIDSDHDGSGVKVRRILCRRITYRVGAAREAPKADINLAPGTDRRQQSALDTVFSVLDRVSSVLDTAKQVLDTAGRDSCGRYRNERASHCVVTGTRQPGHGPVGGRVRDYEDPQHTPWHVTEYANNGRLSLVFSSINVVRRVREYPDDWWTLPIADLIRLSWSR